MSEGRNLFVIIDSLCILYWGFHFLKWKFMPGYSSSDSSCWVCLAQFLCNFELAIMVVSG